MIEIEGFKAFHGTMRITPASTDRQPIDITTDWLYKPMYDCWYGDGASFPAEVCTVLDDQSHEKTADQMFEELGYKKTFEDEDIIEYFKANSRLRIMINNYSQIVSAKDGKSTVYLEYKEILACAKMIEELGW